MATIHESASTVNFDAALLAAAARAKATYPTERCRIERGLAIVLSGGVDVLPTGIALVQSQSQPGVQYTVNGRCSCPDEQRAPGGRCKHRWSKSLYKAALADQKRHAGTDRYWATYYSPDGVQHPGIAAWQADRQCWLFTPEDGTDMLYPAMQALALGGHIATAEAQWQAEGNLVERVCHHSGASAK